MGTGRGAEIPAEVFRKDGPRFPGTLSIQPVRHPAGELRWFLLTCAEGTAPLQGSEAIEAEIVRRTRPLEEALERTRALLHEVDHRVKNSLQVISSLMLLKARRAADPAVQQALHAMTERMSALATMHRLLSAASDPSRFDLKSFVGEFVEDLGTGLSDDRIALRSAVEPMALPSGQATPLALLINELAANALEHAFPDGRTGTVLIGASRHGDVLRLIVEDDGIGLAGAGPDGFGRALIGMLVRQLRGTLTLEDADPGTRAVVAFPFQETAQA